MLDMFIAVCESLQINNSQYPNVSSPEELLRWMNHNIKYSEYTTLKSAQEVLDTRCGSCHDQVMFEKYMFSKLNIPHRTLFMIEYTDGNSVGGRTHTLLYYIKNHKYFWFENAWGGLSGIHGPYKSVPELKQTVKMHMLKNSTHTKVLFTSVPSIKPGATLANYVSACIR